MLNIIAEDLAFVHWQYNANEKAYAARLITKAMYEFARGELQRNLERLAEACCDA